MSNEPVDMNVCNEIVKSTMKNALHVRCGDYSGTAPQFPAVMPGTCELHYDINTDELTIRLSVKIYSAVQERDTALVREQVGLHACEQNLPKHIRMDDEEFANDLRFFSENLADWLGRSVRRDVVSRVHD